MAAVLSENFALTVPAASVSLVYPLSVAAVALHGPTAGALVAALTSVSFEDVTEQIPLTTMAYNFGQLVIVTVAGGWAFIALGAVPLAAHDAVAVDSGSWLQSIAGVAAMAVICGAGNVVLASLGMWSVHGGTLRGHFTRTSWAIPSQLILAFVGYLIALVLNISILGFLLFVFPLAVAREMYVNYEKVRVAYVDTIRSLVGAVEAKDPYTRGHSERVSELSVAAGKAMGIDAQSLRSLEYAALLHDVGKLAIPQEILTKPGTLTAEEYSTIQAHSARGADMVSCIVALRGLAAPVRHHHEKWDGTGYPDRLNGEDIPLLARILCVADSYDAMTSVRSYRPALTATEAAAELVRCAGTQFDATAVRHFLGEVMAAEADGDDALSIRADSAPSSGESS